MTGEEMAACKVPDKLSMFSYLSHLYEAFRGEIPHIKHLKLVKSIINFTIVINYFLNITLNTFFSFFYRKLKLKKEMKKKSQLSRNNI